MFFPSIAIPQASDLFYYILTNEGGAPVLLGLLNSSIGALLSELYGRSYGGGVLDLKVYEVAQMPVLLASALTTDQRSGIEKIFRTLAEAVEERAKIEDKVEAFKSKTKKEKGLFETEIRGKLNQAVEHEREISQELDNLIFDVLELTKKERKQVVEGLKELQELRIARTKS